MSVDSSNSVLNVIQNYFGSQQIPDYAHLLYNELILLDHTRLGTTDTRQQERLLDEMDAGLRQAWRAFSNLEPEITKTLETAHRENSKKRLQLARRLVAVSDSDGGQPLAVFDPVQLIFTSLLAGLYGGDAESFDIPARVLDGQVNAIETARKEVGGLRSINTQEKAHDTWAKVALIKNARKIWENYTGEAPPLKPSIGSRYYAFVADLIEALGRDWNVEATFQSWLDRSKTR
ncbi:hypothetical protein AAFO92_19345 [Roseovarius sp. CAU 1744]|uniref:hypothetical protein n=1 Tax=Roseovarius sp. CAU 1744 TaxID=3140368 RepID=UPI00325BF5C5